MHKIYVCTVCVFLTRYLAKFRFVVYILRQTCTSCVRIRSSFITDFQVLSERIFARLGGVEATCVVEAGKVMTMRNAGRSNSNGRNSSRRERKETPP